MLLIILLLGGWFTYAKFFREEPEVFANDEEHFKYGSLGAEGDRGIPYYLWLVLPRVFPGTDAGPRRLQIIRSRLGGRSRDSCRLCQEDGRLRARD